MLYYTSCFKELQVLFVNTSTFSHFSYLQKNRPNRTIRTVSVLRLTDNLHKNLFAGYKILFGKRSKENLLRPGAFPIAGEENPAAGKSDYSAGAISTSFSTRKTMRRPMEIGGTEQHGCTSLRVGHGVLSFISDTPLWRNTDSLRSGQIPHPTDADADPRTGPTREVSGLCRAPRIRWADRQRPLR